MVTKANTDPDRIVNITRAKQGDGYDRDEVEVCFATSKMLEYVKDRLDRKLDIFFGTKSSGGLSKMYLRVTGLAWP
ncbi:MAG: hypothetical protein ACKPKO_43105, partial [Candidatus Fonsibacter sp.]